MTFPIGLVIGCVILTQLLQTSFAAAADAAVITDIAGVRTTAAIQRMASDRLFLESEPLREMTLDMVRSIVFDHPLLAPTGGGACVWLANGDRIAARAVDIKNDALRVSWPVLEEAAIEPIPLERVSAVILDLPATIGERMRLFADLETLPPGNDVVMLLNGDRSLGEIQQLDAAFLELKSGNSVLKLDRSRIRALRMNPELTNAARVTGRRATLTLTDGSRLTTTSLEATSETLTLKSAAIKPLKLPWKDIHACHLYGGRLIPLSDYEPQKVEFTPYLSTMWPLVRNANVRYGPLTLRGMEYVSGLGTHSRMLVSYMLKGNESEFQTVVGIDDIANGAGSVVFAIDVDDQRVWMSPEITGKSAPVNVPSISLKGRKRLTLIVEFGQYADVSDYADWCDPVLLINAD
ncbi:NPCBM/NEW2 domain-containing protein [Schlesneria paludicola]|uniref:NPCBM/NEW2 domain-containing protein n=1 Tax=Schlesneria paludicola TaxID=360056 RepID=UPI0012F7E1AC|nr:NPCBM/NEW2 domain-containing protein [Schlesneria paludicola]